MGNDGGSIPYRIDLVKTAGKKEARDEKAVTRDLWFFCALSKLLLEAPVVADPAGKVYNKDKLLEFLLDKEGSGMGDGDKICGYVKGVKDIINLNPTPNPSHASSSSSTSSFQPPKANLNPLSHSSDTDSSLSHHPFICPLTMREMNGASGGFVAMKGCGCVLSEVGLKGVLSAEDAGSPDAGGSGSGSAEEVDTGTMIEGRPQVKPKGRNLPCPNCSASFFLPTFALSTLSTASTTSHSSSGTTEKSDPTHEQLRALPWIQLNPRLSLQTALLENLAEDRALAKAAKGESKRKRKAAAAGLGADGIEATGVDLDQAPPRKSKKTSSSTPTANQASSALPTRITAELAALEAQREAARNPTGKDAKGNEGPVMSEALRSIYGPKGGSKKKETSNDQFFRTFNRYAS